MSLVSSCYFPHFQLDILGARDACAKFHMIKEGAYLKSLYYKLEPVALEFRRWEAVRLTETGADPRRILWES